MHVQPISTFRLFQEGHLLRNSIAIFVLTTLFYFIGAELRLVHELSLFWPLNGVMAGVFARYVWLNRLHYYAISYVAMLVYDAITTEWGLVSLAINFSNMMFIVTVALLVARDKRLGKNKYEPVSALRLFNYCLLAALLCAIVGAIGSVSIDSLDFWPLLADWFSEQFSTGVLIVPCMLTLAIPGVLPRFKAEQMMPAIALIVSVIASVVIGGAGSLAFPLPALIWCAVRYTPQVTLQRVLASNSPANRILLIMGEWLAVQRRNGQLSDILFISLNDRLNDISAVLAGCERIAYTPIPFAYTLILHRTVYLFCIMLPFALVVDLHYMTPFISVLISYTFISLDCLAEELEDPFGTENNDLPLDAICNAIEIDLLQMNDEAEIPAKILPDRHYQLT